MARYKPYCLYAPPLEVLSGGIRVMWGLYGWLLAKGQIAYMNEYPQVDRIAIYPEIAHGNPIGAGTVVRYILNALGVMASGGVAGPTQFDPNDKIFVFSKIYDTFGVDSDHLLFLPILNTQLFKDHGNKRTKSAYFIGKGVNTLHHPKDAILIDRSVATDQAGLAELLNQCHTLYGYENITAMYELARLCGVEVRLHGAGKAKWAIYESGTNGIPLDWAMYEPGTNGISFDMNKRVPLHTKDFREHYINMIRTFSTKLDRFIELTQ